MSDPSNDLQAPSAEITELVDYVTGFTWANSQANGQTNGHSLFVPDDLRPPELTPNALTVINRRIATRDVYGNPTETPTELFWRVAWAVSAGAFDDPYHCDWTHRAHTCAPMLFDYRPGQCDRADLARKFYNLMASGSFMPNSPCLVNAGRDLGQLSACFVLPVGDSIDEIFTAVKNTALIHKTGGGTGFDFSELRPAGSHVLSTSGVASGPISFMKVFDAATESIKQGGVRRGANMGILSINHPDILEFIDLKGTIDPKTGRTPLENFNISVAITDEFMDQLISDEHNSALWLDTGLTVRQIWDRICDNAWHTGDPGVIFIDRMNDGTGNPVPSMGPIKATNPCGEQMLYPYDSCNLGSINLAKFVRPEMSDSSSSDVPTGEAVADCFDTLTLAQTVALAVNFLDCVITINRYPLPEIETVTRNIRRIGLGVMGWADALIELGIPYSDPVAASLGESVMKIINNAARTESYKLGQARGSFPLFDQSIYAAQLSNLRNSTRTTIAPTGTISIIAGCSSGIEPIYSSVFEHHHKLERDDADAWTTLYEVHPRLKDQLHDLITYVFGTSLDDFEHQLIETISSSGITSDEFRSLFFGEVNNWRSHHHLFEQAFVEISARFDRIVELFRGANEISPSTHIAMQAAFQLHTDNAVSKTINLHESATPADIADAYQLAYNSGCKGITIYRNNSRSVQVLGGTTNTSTGDTTGTEAAKVHVEAASGPGPDPEQLVDLSFDIKWSPEISATGRRHLPAERQAINHKFTIAGQEVYLTVGLYPDGSPGEIFIETSKQGSTVNGLVKSFAILTSIGLQYEIPLSVLYDKFKHTRFDPAGITDNKSIPFATSIIDYVFRWLELKFDNELIPATNNDQDGHPAVEDYAIGGSMGRPISHTDPTSPTSPQPTGHICGSCGGLMIPSGGCMYCTTCGDQECGG